MEYKLIRDVRFHDNEKQEFFFIKKGSVFPEVARNNQTYQIKNTLKVCKRLSSDPNAQFIVLDTDGFQRVFEIRKHIVPHQKRTIRRIRRNRR